MFTRVYSELSKIDGISEHPSGRAIFTTATVFKLFLNDKAWEKINQMGNCAEAEKLIKSVVIFIYDVVLCSEDEFFKMWGEHEIVFDIYEIIEDLIIKDEELYDVILKLQSRLNKILIAKKDYKHFKFIE